MAERQLWTLLRNRQLSGAKFRRQYPIGRDIVDFACIEARLIVEADGGQHDGSVQDEQRTRRLESAGWRVLRLWNNDVLKNPEGVALTIGAAL